MLPTQFFYLSESTEVFTVGNTSVKSTKWFKNHVTKITLDSKTEAQHSATYFSGVCVLIYGQNTWAFLLFNLESLYKSSSQQKQ